MRQYQPLSSYLRVSRGSGSPYTKRDAYLPPGEAYQSALPRHDSLVSPQRVVAETPTLRFRPPVHADPLLEIDYESPVDQWLARVFLAQAQLEVTAGDQQDPVRVDLKGVLEEHFSAAPPDHGLCRSDASLPSNGPLDLLDPRADEARCAPEPEPSELACPRYLEEVVVESPTNESTPPALPDPLDDFVPLA